LGIEISPTRYVKKYVMLVHGGRPLTVFSIFDRPSLMTSMTRMMKIPSGQKRIWKHNLGIEISPTRYVKKYVMLAHGGHPSRFPPSFIGHP
jgi:hypothetical protein